MGMVEQEPHKASEAGLDAEVPPAAANQPLVPLSRARQSAASVVLHPPTPSNSHLAFVALQQGFSPSHAHFGIVLVQLAPHDAAAVPLNSFRSTSTQKVCRHSRAKKPLKRHADVSWWCGLHAKDASPQGSSLQRLIVNDTSPNRTPLQYGQSTEFNSCASSQKLPFGPVHRPNPQNLTLQLCGPKAKASPCGSGPILPLPLVSGISKRQKPHREQGSKLILQMDCSPSQVPCLQCQTAGVARVSSSRVIKGLVR